MYSASRRRFLVRSGQAGAAALVAMAMPRFARADVIGGPIGIQLYAVRDALEKDTAGTLKAIAGIGFREVETAGYGSVDVKTFRRLLDDNGLACPSMHLSFEPDKIAQSLEDAHTLGATYAGTGSLSGLVAPQKGAKGMGLEEAKRAAELCNRLGEQAKQAGLQFTYHNHAHEFVDQGRGKIGFDVMLRETDPALVKFQIDCGWMVVGGHDPIAYFKRHPGRFTSLHIKDFQPADNASAGAEEAEPRGAELGRGRIDYRPILVAAKKHGIKHFFVEQEGPFERMDSMHAARIGYDYLHGLD